MSFSLYLGPFDPFLEEELFQSFKAYREKNPFEKVTILVPNFLLVGYLRQVLTEKGRNLFNLEIYTLRHYMERVGQDKPSAESFKHLPDVLVPFVLKEISRPLLAHSIFNSVKDTPGFYHSLRSVLMELQEGLYTPEALKTHSDAFIRSRQESFGHKLRVFSDILLAYERWKTKNHWRDQGDADREVLKAPVVSSGPVWIYGFYDASELQKKVLWHLTRTHESLWFIPFEADHPAFEYAERFVQWVRSVGKVLGEAAWKDDRQTPLRRLQHFLFRDSKGVAQAQNGSFEGSDCKILLCPGEPGEAREIVRFTLEEAQRQDVFLSDCAVILRETEPYRKILPSAFAAQGVPLARALRSPVWEELESKALLLLLDCFLQDFPREGLMNFLSCSNLNPMGFGLDPGEWNPSRWDVISREAQVVQGEKEWISRLLLWRQTKKNTDAQEEETFLVTGDLRAAGGVEKVLAQLFDAKARLDHHPAWKDKARQLQEFLGKFLYPSAALREVLEVLEAFIVLSESFTLSLPPEDFYGLMSAMLKEKKSQVRSLETGGAQIVDLMQSRGLSFEVVVLPGLVEKSVPRLVRQDPMLLDEERMELNKKDKDAFIGLKQWGAMEERMLFALAVRSAKKALILTAPILNPSTGSPRAPSIYLYESVEAIWGRRIRRLEEAACVREVSVNDGVRADITQCVNSLELLLTAMAQARKGDKINAQALVREKPFYFEGCQLLKARQDRATFTAYEGILSSPASHAALRKKYALEGMAISASRLETFAACPSRYFFRYVLNIQNYPEPEKVLRLQARDRGNLMHAILEKTLQKGLREAWVAQKNPAEGAKALQECAQEVFRQFERQGVTGASGLWQWEKEQMIEDMAMVLRGVLSDLEWTPLALETSFGDQGSLVYFILRNGQKFRLQGRMDRIDISSDGQSLRVVDYKTGVATGVKNNSVKEGTKLQLPFYLWALKRIHPHKDSSLALYDFITRRADYKQTIFDLKEVGPIEPLLDQIFSTWTRSLEKGLFPAVARACDHCDYRKLCGTDMESLKARGQRKKKDPQASDYYGLETLP